MTERDSIIRLQDQDFSVFSLIIRKVIARDIEREKQDSSKKIRPG